MRNLVATATGLVLLATIATTLAACESGPGAAKDPPLLTVTSPARSTVQGHAGSITVTGTVVPNAAGDAIREVLVNGVQATVAADGSFHAAIDVPAGATLVETVARDANGTTASDTRAIHAGALRAVGTSVERAVTAAISADAFTKLSAAAGPILKGLDMPALLAPLQPMVDVGDSLANLELLVDDLKFSDVQLSLAPVQGGLMLSAEIDQLDVPAHANYGGILVPDGSTTLRVTAGKITIAGTLQVTPAGMAGFRTTISHPMVNVTGLHFDASGLPGEILDLLDVDSTVQFIVARGAEIFATPLVNLALGALAGPQKLSVLGKQLDLQVAPSALAFSPTGGVVAMNMTALLEGSQASPGFIFTDNGAPAMDAGYGLQIGLADDLLNELFAELHALGLLNLSVPNDAGAFDTAQIQMTLPPMISASAASGDLHLVLGDMFATFTRKGTPVAKAAINATVDLQIAPVGGGGSVALQLGKPDIHVDALDDIANTTGLSGKDLSSGVAATLGAQIDAISRLLVAIPLPAVAGLHVRNLAIDSDAGYVMLSGQLE